MGHIEVTKELNAAPDALHKTVSDPQTWGDWFSIHERWMEEPPATLAVGSKLTAKILMLGMANKIEWVVEELEAPGKLVLSGTGMAGVKCKFSFTMTASETGTTFTVSGDFDGALIKGALGKAVEKDGLKQLDKSLAALSALSVA